MCVILRLSMFFRFRQHVWKRNDESGRRGGEGKVYNFLGAGGESGGADFLLFSCNTGLLMIKKKPQRVWSPGRHHAGLCM